MESQDHKPWHSLSVREVEEILSTSERGLSDEEAARRLEQYGKNDLRQKKPKSILKMLWEQVSDVMVLILIAAAVFSMVMQEWAEAVIILAVVALNAVIGIIKEKKAANALAALKSMSAPTARVLREGEESVVPASELVPGDYIYLEDGAIVPADIRIVADSNIKIQEAALTGESVPSEKDGPSILPEDAPLGDRVNMAYTSSVVMYGNAQGIVVGTGMNTEVGKIAGMLEEEDDLETPLKKKLNSVGKILSFVGLVVCVLVFVIGMLRGRQILPLVMTAISLAISIIPEGLPATATIIMALGVQRMAKKNALVRNLPAVETLGGATVICCDKTGTLTLNKMTVTHVAINGDFVEGNATDASESVQKYGDLCRDLVFGCALCNNASKDPDRPGETLGDPTEGALLFYADKFGDDYDQLKTQYPRLFEQPFDSVRKRMTTVHEIGGKIVAYTKGAVDEMLPLCTHVLTKEGVRAMTEEDRAQILALVQKMSAEALRLLGFAKRELAAVPDDEEADVEVNMTFVGAVGMIDPPRNEVIGAVETCHTAGIQVIMITGDHKITATAIAKQLHIYQEGNIVVTGQELDEMTDDELDAAVKKTTVFARVSPSDKMRIIRSLKRNGEIAAMTGDGVNDSPALKEADIGVAMGITGTDVAKDAADMILMDDNFTTIEYAVREGRRVYRNIQKVIQFLVAGNIAEILTLFLAVCFNWADPILAVHILLINLATDSLPAIALGVDPSDSNVMKTKPVKSGSLFADGLLFRIVLHGVFISIATLAAYWIGELYFGNHPEAMTMTFIVLAFSQLVHSLNQRSNYDSVFHKNKEHNFYLFGAMAVSAAIALAVLLIPPLQGFFKFVSLGWKEWLIAIGLSLFPLVAVEISKIFMRASRKRKSV